MNVSVKKLPSSTRYPMLLEIDRLESPLMQLRSPEMRSRLIEHLKELSDFEYQKTHWKVFKEKSGTYDEFDYTVHFLYDDTDLASDPLSLIGWVLYSQEEASSVQKLTDALEIVFQANGMTLGDQDYIMTKEWPLVLQAASEALSVIREGS